MTVKVEQASKKVEAYVKAERRYFHRHPELRWQEENTLRRITGRLTGLKFARGYVKKIVKKAGGVWMDVTVNPAFDRILFRADVDALPVREETGLSFSSVEDGLMHACGHDTHISMLLGFCRALGAPLGLKHNLRIVFQRAEENPGYPPQPVSGGDMLVKEGVLKGISKVYALHVKPGLESGAFFSRQGPYLGNSDRLGIFISTEGGHVMTPNKGCNAQRVAQSIQNVLDSFPVRSLGPLELNVLEPTGCLSGKGQATSNIMPARAELWYAVRTFLGEGERRAYIKRVEDEVNKAAARFPGSAVRFKVVLGHPATVNSDFYAVKEILRSGGLKARECEPNLGGEDFAYYLRGRKGSLWFMGVGGGSPLHSSKFKPDESALLKGVCFWALLATS